MGPRVALVCFAVIFLGELPDKTMFANLVMATRGRPRQVWLGAAGAFVAHVAIAVTIGVALFKVLPGRSVDAVVAGLFLFGAAYAWREGTKTGGRARASPAIKARRRAHRLRGHLPRRVGRPDPDPHRQPGRQVPTRRSTSGWARCWRCGRWRL